MAKVLKSKGVVVSISKKERPHEKRLDKSTAAKSARVSVADASYDFCSREGIMLSHIAGAELKLVEVVSDEINESTNTDYYARWVGNSRNVRSDDFFK